MSQPNDSPPPSPPLTGAEKLALKREARIKAAFSAHESTGAGRTDRVTLQASASYLSDHTDKSVLQQVRVLYPGILQSHTHHISNLLLWHVHGEPTKVAVLVFTAEHFLSHIDHRTLDGCVQFAVSQLPNYSIIFAVSAIDRVLEVRNRKVVRQGTPELVFSRQALQDCYTHLDVEYGVRIHVSPSHAELAHTVRDWTDAIAKLPNHREEDFLEATLQYRRNRGKGATGAVIALGGPTLVEGSDDDDIDIDAPMGPHIRAEGPGDVSFWYVSMIRMIPGVSVHKAKAIRMWFPSLELLMEGYRRCANDAMREALLANIRFGPNRRRIGPQLSKTIYHFFHGQEAHVAVST